MPYTQQQRAKYIYEAVLKSMIGRKVSISMLRRIIGKYAGSQERTIRAYLNAFQELKMIKFVEGDTWIVLDAKEASK